MGVADVLHQVPLEKQASGGVNHQLQLLVLIQLVFFAKLFDKLRVIPDLSHDFLDLSFRVIVVIHQQVCEGVEILRELQQGTIQQAFRWFGRHLFIVLLSMRTL